MRLVLALIFAASAFADDNAPPEGFTAIFNGKDLSGWKATDEAKKHWIVRDGVIDYDGQNEDLWYDREFGDFILKVDWRFPRKPVDSEHVSILPDGTDERDAGGNYVMIPGPEAGDSGIYLRGSSKSQVNLWCWPVGSGEVFGYRTDETMPPDIVKGVTPKKKADKPLGEWNSFTITMKGDRLTVVLNGEEVLSDARLPGVDPKGPIALQNHGDPVQFKNIYVKELPSK